MLTRDVLLFIALSYFIKKNYNKIIITTAVLLHLSVHPDLRYFLFFSLRVIRPTSR